MGDAHSGVGRGRSPRRGTAGIACARLAIILWLVGMSPCWADGVKRVLIIHSSDSARPASLLVDAAVRRELQRRFPSGLNIFTEFLDADRFSGDGHEARMEAYLREKYAGMAPDVLI